MSRRPQPATALRNSAPLPLSSSAFWAKSEAISPTTVRTATPKRDRHPSASRLIDGRFRIDPIVLGVGTWAEVRVAYDVSTGTKVAAKVISKDKLREKDRVLIDRECKAMATLNHPNIVHLIHVAEDSDNIYLFLEYMGGGDLLALAIRDPKLVAARARKYFQQVVSAIEYLHKKGICHRDIKLENLLLNESLTRVAITDFGLCDFISSEPLTVYCGSPAYASPELVTRTPYSGIKSDTWALGVVLYTLLCGVYPFEGTDIHSLYKQIVEAKPCYPRPISPRAVSLLEGMLRKDPSRRLSIAEVANHEWMRGSFVNVLRDTARGLFDMPKSLSS